MDPPRIGAPSRTAGVRNAARNGMTVIGRKHHVRPLRDRLARPPIGSDVDNAPSMVFPPA